MLLFLYPLFIIFAKGVWATDREEFITRYPQNGFIQKAKARIEDLEWQEATNVNSISGYQKFLDKYPTSKYYGQARARIAKIEWARTLKRNTIEAYQEFLQTYPQSEFTVEANLRIEKLIWEASKKKNTVEAYQEFLRRYPQSEFTAKAEAKIQELKQYKYLQSFEGTIVSIEIGFFATTATTSGQLNPNWKARKIYLLELAEYTKVNFVINDEQLINAGFKFGEKIKGEKLLLKAKKERNHFLAMYPTTLLLLRKS